MNNRLNTVLLVLTVALFSACNDDKEDDTKNSTNDKKVDLPDNHFTIGDTKYVAEKVNYRLDQIANEHDGMMLYRNELDIITGGFTVDNFGEIISGSGSALVLEVTSSDGEGLSVGNYNFSGSEDTYTDFEFWDGSAYVNLVFDSDAETEYEFVTGNMKVTKLGEKYTIVITGTARVIDTEDVPVKIEVYYTGEIAYKERN